MGEIYVNLKKSQPDSHFLILWPKKAHKLRLRGWRTWKFGSSFDMANPMDTEYSRKFLQDCRYMSHLHFWTFWERNTTVDRKYRSMFETGFWKKPVQTLSSKILMASNFKSRFCRYVPKNVSYRIVDFFRKQMKLERAEAWSLLFCIWKNRNDLILNLSDETRDGLVQIWQLDIP